MVLQKVGVDIEEVLLNNNYSEYSDRVSPWFSNTSQSQKIVNSDTALSFLSSNTAARSDMFDSSSKFYNEFFFGDSRFSVEPTGAKREALLTQEAITAVKGDGSAISEIFQSNYVDDVVSSSLFRNNILVADSAKLSSDGNTIILEFNNDGTFKNNSGKSINVNLIIDGAGGGGGGSGVYDAGADRGSAGSPGSTGGSSSISGYSAGGGSGGEEGGEYGGGSNASDTGNGNGGVGGSGGSNGSRSGGNGGNGERVTASETYSPGQSVSVSVGAGGNGGSPGRTSIYSGDGGDDGEDGSVRIEVPISELT